jgi:hypothetical protein
MEEGLKAPRRSAKFCTPSHRFVDKKELIEFAHFQVKKRKHLQVANCRKSRENRRKTA